jgi:hypothetical protein
MPTDFTGNYDQFTNTFVDSPMADFAMFSIKNPRYSFLINEDIVAPIIS